MSQEHRRSSGPSGGQGSPAPAQGNGGGRHVRRRKRKGYGCFGAIFYVIFVIGASALIAGLGWLAADDVLSLTKPEAKAVVEIKEGESIDDIAKQLKEDGLIKYPFLFKLYLSLSSSEEKIDPGKYELNTEMDYRALGMAMRKSSLYRSTISVMIPEGFEQDQILKKLAENGVSSYEELKKSADTDDFAFSFLEGVPKGNNRLEGYLFPDTYEFYVNEAPKEAIKKMLSVFNKKLTEQLREKAEDMEMSIREVLTVASLIEKEAANDEERAAVASVIYNRLKSDKYPYLQIDATIQYALPERKARLTNEDLKFESPYNTYQNKGLPPGPIACPGINSIKAALYPANTNFYFYVLTKEGVHKFSKTLEEHNAAIAANAN